jgi:3-hydroxybutyryl-CoA dehydrogenase
MGDLGIKINRDGTFALDTMVLGKSLKSNPEGVAAMFTNGVHGVYATFDKMARAVASSTDPGSLGGVIDALGKTQKTLGTQLSDLQAKQEALAAISAHVTPEAIVTSTTSSILVTQLAPLVSHPQRFLNAHWLNPAYLIPVVELSTHAGTSADALARTREILEGIGKLPVVCGPTPGYIVPRLQALVMNEAARMVEEGAATAEEIDRATRFGLGLRFAALGVVEFIDFGGADILHHASREMSASVDAQRYRAPAIIDRMVAEGRLGLKTGSGFFDHASQDVAAYRRDVLSRTLGMLRHAGLYRPPAATTLS